MLRRILLRGKVRRLRYIVEGNLVCSNKQRAIRSVSLFSETSGEIKTGRTYLFLSSLSNSTRIPNQLIIWRLLPVLVAVFCPVVAITVPAV